MPFSAFSHLEREIREQPSVLAARTEPGWEGAGAAAAVLRREDVDYLVIAARGTSDNAARYAQYLFGFHAAMTAGLAAPWLFAGDFPSPEMPMTMIHRSAGSRQLRFTSTTKLVPIAAPASPSMQAAT